jgi:hypothetical protein
MNGSGDSLIILMLSSLHKHTDIYNRVALDVYLYIAYLLADDQFILDGDVTTVERSDEVAETLSACINAHRERVFYLFSILHDECTVAEGQSVGMNARRQMLHVDSTKRCPHVIDVLYQPSVAVKRNGKRIGEHLVVIEHGVLVLYVDREIIGQRHRTVVDKYGEM